MSAARTSGGDTTTRRPTFEDLLDEELEHAARDLTAATGGSSLCAVSRTSGPVPAAKYHEGRWVALREVSRLHDPDVSDRLEAATPAREHWAQQLAHLLAHESGPDWVAYRSGGVDALDRLVGRLRESRRPAS